MAERVLDKYGIAKELGVSPKTAAKLMKQMRRINISGNPNSLRPRWVVPVSEFELWLRESLQEPERIMPRPRKDNRVVYLDPNLFEPDGRIKRRRSS